MIMHKEYLDEMKEHIEGMEEEEFTKRGTIREDVLGNQDTMERLWCVYQKDVEDYDCDREFSLWDAVNEVLGSAPAAASEPVISVARYRCPFCGSERFIGISLSVPTCMWTDMAHMRITCREVWRQISMTLEPHTARSPVPSADRNLTSCQKTDRKGTFNPYTRRKRSYQIVDYGQDDGKMPERRKSKYYKDVKNGRGTNLAINTHSYLSVGPRGTDIMIRGAGKVIAFDCWEDLIGAIDTGKATYHNCDPGKDPLE